MFQSKLIYPSDKNVMTRCKDSMIFMKVTILSSYKTNKVECICIDFSPSNTPGDLREPCVSIRLNEKEIIIMKYEIENVQNELLHIKDPIIYSIKNMIR